MGKPKTKDDNRSLTKGDLNSSNRKITQIFADKFLLRILKDIEDPLIIIVEGAVYFIFTILFLKVGAMILDSFFTKEPWFLKYLDTMAVSALILSYIVFVIMGLISYFYKQMMEIKKRKEVEHNE